MRTTHMKMVCLLSCSFGACGGSQAVAELPVLSAAGASAAGAAGAAIPPAAVSGGPAVAPPKPAGCRERFTFAVRTSLDMTWPDAIGTLAGRGKLRAWGKVTLAPSADGVRWEEAPCGVALPVVTTTPLVDGIKLFNEVPTRTFDVPSMPRSSGVATWRDGMLAWDSVTILGSRLSDPRAKWPQRRSLMLVDHDADGRPGITALPRDGAGFGLPPIDIGQTQHADAIYIAARIALRVSVSALGCEGAAQGSAAPLSFDYTIVGCHAVDSGECPESSINLLGNNSPEFELGANGEWSARPIAESASCLEVVAALPDE